jgi:transcriptional regulator with XRE-family HTH domain
VRERRTALGISQPKLAAALGIAYQQLYKYEQAKNRISASRLHQLSKVLGVPVTFFFEGIAGTDATNRRGHIRGRRGGGPSSPGFNKRSL